MKKPSHHKGNIRESMLDEAGDESFPASDPLAWNLGLDSNNMSNKSSVAKILAQEHNLIKKIIRNLTIIVEKISTQKKIDKKCFNEIQDFFHHFVEDSHHSKEEILYQSLKQSNEPPSAYLLKDLINEHALGKHLLHDLDKMANEKLENLTAQQREDLIRLLKDIQHLYLTHIEKEEEYIFPQMSRMLDSKTEQTILLQFDKLNQEININQFSHLLDLEEKK